MTTTNQVRRLDASRVGPVLGLLVDDLVPSDAHVVIPAKNKAGSIAATIVHLVRLGFPKKRIHVIVNGSDDNTEAVARNTNAATVWTQDEALGLVPHTLATMSKFRIDESDLSGKGFAMFMGVLVLEHLGVPDDAPVIFLDADIANLDAVNPVGCLLAGWHVWREDRPDIIKLAAQGRQNEGVIAYLNNTELFNIGALEWPLCGQVIVPWKVLREMRFASRYGVEIAMLIHIMWRRRSLRAFGEVALSVPLVDDANSDAVHTRMYTTIIGFVSDLLRTTRGHHGLLGYPEIGAFNTLGPMRSYIPSSTGTSSHLEDLPRDRILPSVQDIRLATRLAGG